MPAQPLGYASQPRADPLHGLRRGDDRDHLHVGDVAPAGDPLVEQAAIVALHELVAAAHVRRDPARDVGEAVRRLAPFVPEPPVYRNGIAVLEALDDHVEHPLPLSFTAPATGAVAATRVAARRRALSERARRGAAGTTSARG